MKIISLFFILFFLLISCTNGLSEKDYKKYTKQGLEIAQATQRILGLSLTKKMKNGGVKAAIPFCNTMASPLTKQMSQKYDVNIKRTSDKIRNDKNKASAAELKIIKLYQNKVINKQELKPVVKTDDSENIHFYAPIILQKKCLACHGTMGKEVTKQTDSIIKSIYANDSAVSYREGDLRGIWSIQFKKN